MSVNGQIKQRRYAEALWVEKLGVLDIVSTVFLRPSSDKAIYYGERGESYPARKILSLIKLFKIRLNIFAISLSLEKEDPDGSTLSYKAREDLLLCCEKFIEKYLSGRSLRFKNAVKCHLSDTLRSRIAFASIIESKTKQMRDKRHIIRFKKHPANKILYRFYEERGFVVKESASMFGYKHVVNMLRLIANVIIARITLFQPGSNITSIRQSIWIEYAHKDVVDFAFWKKHVDSALFDIVYYLDRRDTPVEAGITGEIERSGAKWIDAHPGAMASYISISTLLIFLKDLFRPDGRPLWVKVFDFEYNFWKTAYTACFKKYKVKIVIQHRDTLWIQEPQAVAIEAAGGIMMGFHWSNYPHQMTPDHLFPHHLFFIWGRAIKNFLPEKEDVRGYTLPSGVCMFKDRIDLSDMAKRLKDLKFTFTVFDSSVAYNIHQTPYSLSQFYLLLLDLLEKNMSWGAVVKSKSGDINSNLMLPRGEEIVSRFQSLIKLGRVFFLESRLSPVTASALTKISVCYGLNSAGIVAGTYGYKSLHWDCAGWTFHPFYNDRQQKIIFKTLEELKDAIERVSRGDISIGDFSNWKKEFNYFDDFNADRRVGEFIQDVMDMSFKTTNAQDILDFAAKRYIERNNIENDFFEYGSSPEPYKNCCGAHVS